MATSQSQSKGIEDQLEDQEVQEKKSKGTIKEKDIGSANYKKTKQQVIYDWDEYFMSVACLAALRSKDPRTPVRYCHYYIAK